MTLWAVRRSESTPPVLMDVCFVLAWTAWQTLRHFVADVIGI